MKFVSVWKRIDRGNSRANIKTKIHRGALPSCSTCKTTVTRARTHTKNVVQVERNILDVIKYGAV